MFKQNFEAKFGQLLLNLFSGHCIQTLFLYTFSPKVMYLLYAVFPLPFIITDTFPSTMEFFGNLAR